MSDNKVYELLEIIANSNEGQKEYTKAEKIKAAYALNLCMVSVSQIVDYNDIIILEQEYEAILNNLNLEEMPKDEAFLDILKQILDTITFFRIQEGDKKFIEKEYKHKMKNAIWSAVSNIPIFAMSGNPVQTAISVATTIGSGYMNYRKVKAENALEKEKQEWKLQRSAIEQFNGLRRELFNTAWKIASEYDFPDEYRLTEKQISQYDSILMDNNYLRRYDRFDAIKDNFKAYPTFWYFFGNTAAVLSNDQSLTPELRKDYKEKAKMHFARYEETNCYGLLREDQITASWALEYIDLFDTKKDREKIQKLLNTAVKMCGNANDILQLCALAYLKIEDYTHSAEILRILVNESYNQSVNAQLLSKIYVYDYIHNHDNNAILGYEKLKLRTANTVLMPMPERSESETDLESRFMKMEKIMVSNRLGFVLGSLVQKYTVSFNKIIDPFGGIYEDEYYLDNFEKSIELRQNDALEVFKNRTKRRKYLNELSQINIFFSYLDLFNKFLPDLFKLKFINDQTKQEVKETIIQALKDAFNAVNEVEQKISTKEFSFVDYEKLCQITFYSLVENAFNVILKYFEKVLSEIDNMQSLTELDVQIELFREDNNLPEIVYKNDLDTVPEVELCIPPKAFGEEVVIEYQKRLNFRKMKQLVEESIDEIINPDSSTRFLIEGTNEFNDYCNSNEKMKKYVQDTFAVFDIEGSKDLAFTVSGIVKIASNELIYYNQVSCKSNKLILNDSTYKVSDIKNIAFEELCVTLSACEEDIKKWGHYFNTVTAIKSVMKPTALNIGAFALFGVPGALAVTAASALKAASEAKATSEEKTISKESASEIGGSLSKNLLKTTVGGLENTISAATSMFTDVTDEIGSAFNSAKKKITSKKSKKTPDNKSDN